MRPLPSVPPFRHVPAQCIARTSTHPQVASTNEIQVGSWIRIYALDRYSGPSRRGRLLRDVPAASAAAAAGNATRNGRNDIASSIESGISSDLALPPLPLTPGLSRALARGRQELAAEKAEEQQGVWAAAAAGSLDAYLYGEQAGAPSGQSELIAAAGAGRAACCRFKVCRRCAHCRGIVLPLAKHRLHLCHHPPAPADMYDKADHVRFSSR